MKNDPINFVPRSALAPGILSLLPVISLTPFIFDQAPKVHDEALSALIAYGVVILSFLGGAKWGLVISGASPVKFAFQLGIIVLPSLAGWVAILIENSAELIVLGVAFSLMLFTDYIIFRCSRLVFAPEGGPQLAGNRLSSYRFIRAINKKFG
jgi:hypothetical protein